MAYRFAGSGATVEFDKTPFSGYTLGGYTAAVLLKRNTLASLQRALFVSDLSFPYFALGFASGAGNSTALDTRAGGGNQHVLGPVCGSSSLWYLLVVTGNGTAIPRWHVHDGTSWAHSTGGAVGGAVAFGSTHRVWVSPPTAWGGEYLLADVVCVGFKKSDSADLAVEALSPTAFPAWTGFGFDWLVGFENSSSLANRGSSGGGGEIARSGTSLVSDPPSWVWVAAVAPVADFTATPLTGTASLSVAFTDTSTNTPTSWAWNFGDGATSTSQNPTHSYTTSGIYTVTLVATNATGSDTKTRTGYITVGETIVYAAGGGIDIYG